MVYSNDNKYNIIHVNCQVPENKKEDKITRTKISSVITCYKQIMQFIMRYSKLLYLTDSVNPNPSAS